jgi:hypothetical protein
MRNTENLGAVIALFGQNKKQKVFIKQLSNSWL